MKWMLGVILLLSLGGGGWWLWQNGQLGGFNPLVAKKEKPVPNLERYEVLEDELKLWRGELVDQYKKARSPEQKAAVEHDARIILELIMPEMMRCWRGTGYDFNGVAERPGQGKIACGYYVSTLIRDAGFKVNRYTLAQQASENILLTFTDKENCQLRVGEKYKHYADWVETLEPGIYIIGLDTHVGFVVIEKDGMKFLHSSGIAKAGVVEEPRDEAAAIKWSKWRMLGHFTADPNVIRMWLAGDNVTVVQ
ncbi:MAG: hypothetical protein V4727_12635 [Verrucomicrobiota bacterium]